MKKGTEEKVFTNWTVKELLGKGAFGRVYRIEREEFGTLYQAAMKKITIPQTNEEIEDAVSEGMDEQSVTSYFKSFVEEIVNEFKLMAQLKGHTNIVSYEDHLVIPHEDGIGWDILIRMELLKSLKTLTAERNLTETEVIKLGIDICNALEVCGKMNIIHRDIKPENIFISNFGEFKLGDFGIARTAEKTMSNLSKKGTYTYMAPEVYKGEAYDATVDIYSLGIVMYRFMNYNRAPFLPAYPQPISFSDREASLTRRISEEPMPAPACGSRELKRIILKACAYQASARYQSPEQLRGDLEKLLQHQEPLQEGTGKVTNAVPDVMMQTEEAEETVTVAAPAMYAEEVEETVTVAVPVMQTEEAEETVTTAAPVMQTEDVEETVTTAAVQEEEATSKQEKASSSVQAAGSGSAAEDDEEDATVSIFDTKEETVKQTRQPKTSVVQQEAPRVQPEKKKKKTGLFIGIGIAAVLLAAAIVIAVAAGGSHTAPVSALSDSEFAERYDLEGTELSDAEEETDFSDAGENTETFEAEGEEIVPQSNQYLYGHYCIGGSGMTGQNPEPAFFEDMETIAIREKEMAAVPCEMYCFPDGTMYDTPLLGELYDECVYDEEIRSGYADRAYLADLGMPEVEVFEGIVTVLFGDREPSEMETEAFYEENIKGQRDAAELTFVDELGNRETLFGYYRIDNSVMDVAYLDLDENGELALRPLQQYGVAFSGKNLCISCQDAEREMEPYSPQDLEDSYEGYAGNMADTYMDISYLYVSAPASGDAQASICFADGWYADNVTVETGEDNTVTITWEQQVKLGDSSEKKEGGGSFTASYLDCDALGLILCVEGQDYFYQKTATEYYAGLLGSSFIDAEADEETLQAMRISQLEMMAAIQEEVQETFEEAGLIAEEVISMDEKTSTIAVNNDNLFEGDGAELSAGGEEYLSRLFSALDTVIAEEGYEEYVDEIIITGHTDSAKDDETNQLLSEEMAVAVDDYCYDMDFGVKWYTDTAGADSTDPVYDGSGNGAQDASGRVVFRITLDAEAFMDGMDDIDDINE